MMDRDRDPVVSALANLPNEHLWSLGDAIETMPASLPLESLGYLVLWERKRRFRELPRYVPEPSSLPIAFQSLY